MGSIVVCNMNAQRAHYGRRWLAILLILAFPLIAGGGGGIERRVMAGDRLRIRVDEDAALNKLYPVAGDGTIDLGFVGRIPLADLTLDAAASAIEKALEQAYFKKATVSVETADYVEGSVMVMGAVATPSTLGFKGDQMMTLMEAITLAGGLTREAAGTEVRILRWQAGGGMTRQIIKVDVQSMIETLDFGKDQFLRPRDIIFVPMLGAGADRKEILALGAVGAPGFHPYSEGLDIIRLVMRVGGVPREAVWSAARILRPDKTGNFQVIPVDLGRLFGAAEMQLNIPVFSGDIFFVPFAEQASRGQVYLLGEVAKPGAVPLTLDQENTLARVLMASGGLGKFANDSKVKILRSAPDGSKQTLVVDVSRILKTGIFDEDVPLQNGDVVIVPEKILGF